MKFEDFSMTLSRILKSKTHQFAFDGKYLMKNGMNLYTNELHLILWKKKKYIKTFLQRNIILFLKMNII